MHIIQVLTQVLVEPEVVSRQLREQLISRHMELELLLLNLDTMLSILLKVVDHSDKVEALFVEILIDYMVEPEAAVITVVEPEELMILLVHIQIKIWPVVAVVLDMLETRD